LSFALSLSNSIRRFTFVTPDMKIDGGFDSVLFLTASCRFSSESVVNILVVGIVPPSQ
jgi:hypothetical protein